MSRPAAAVHRVIKAYDVRGLVGEQLDEGFVTDVGGAFTAGLGYIGDRLGLFEALARRDAWTPRELAEATRLHERYVLEWLKAMVAAEYVEHDGDSGRFFMTLEQRAVLADPGSPVFAVSGEHSIWFYLGRTDIPEIGTRDEIVQFLQAHPAAVGVVSQEEIEDVEKVGIMEKLYYSDWIPTKKARIVLFRIRPQDQ